jgi:nitroreductase
MLKQAQTGILICGDSEIEKNIEYIVQNCSAATQNILLAAHGLGLGGVWVGVYPDKELIKNVKATFMLPEHIIPISLVSLGFPDEKVQAEDRYKVEKIHYNKW